MSVTAKQPSRLPAGSKSTLISENTPINIAANTSSVPTLPMSDTATLAINFSLRLAGIMMLFTLMPLPPSDDMLTESPIVPTSRLSNGRLCHTRLA